MDNGRLWCTSTVHHTGDDELFVDKYYKFGPMGYEFIRATHMDITLCRFKMNKFQLFKMIKIESNLLTLASYG